MRTHSSIYKVLTLLSVIGTLVVLFITADSVGIAPDSYVYVASAESLLSGRGLTIPVGPEESVRSSHFPPLYTGLLAISSLGIAEPQQSGRWLNALLFGANIFLVGITIARLTEGSRRTIVLGALFILGAESMLLIHSHLWSEPPFYFFALLGLFLLTDSIRQQDSPRHIFAALAFALATLIRYAGLTLGITGTLYLILGTNKPWTVRLRSAGIFLLISVGPVGLWMVNNLRLTGSLTNRGIVSHPVNLQGLRRGFETISTWILPSQLFEINAEGRALLALVAILILAMFIVRALRSESAKEASWLPYLLFTIVYPSFILVSISFFDAQTSLDTRILSPAYLSTLILVAVLFGKRLPSTSFPGRAVAGGLVLTLALVVMSGGAIQALRLVRGEGKGYGSPYWMESRLLEQIRKSPMTRPIYSNGHDVIYLLTGKPALPLPQEFSPNSRLDNPDFIGELVQMEHDLREHDGRLVYFEILQNRRNYLPKEDELLELLPLRRLSHWYKEGNLYRIYP